MRFGLIGDVHAEDQRLAVALEMLSAANVDRVLCTGDVVDGLGDVDHACTLLARHGVVTVRGNHDRWIREDTMRTLPNAHRMTTLAPSSIELLKSLPPTVRIDLGGGVLLLCHGVGESDMKKLGPDDSGYALSTNDELMKVLLDASVSVMVTGHTHVPMVRRFERGSGKTPLLVVNAGTLARDDGAGFVVLDLGARRADFHRIAQDLTVSHASRAVL